MMDMPEDLMALKRPALQKLCKKLGIRANGKNAEMIAALEVAKNDNCGRREDVVPDSTSEAMGTVELHTADEEGNEEEEELMTTPTSPVLEEASEKTKVDSNQRKPEVVVVSRSEAKTNLVEDRLGSSGSRQSRKRQRNSSLAAEAAELSDVKKARLFSNHSATNGSSPAVALDSSEETGGFQECSEVNEKIPSFKDDISHDKIGTPVMKTPERSETKIPVSSPPGSASTSKRKRKRRSTYSIDGTEEQGASPLQKKQRRSTFEVSPKKNSQIVGDGGPSDGPCDSTVDENEPTDAGLQSNLIPMETQQSMLPSLSEEPNENDKSIKEDMMSLLDKRVTERMADPNYVPAYNGEKPQDAPRSAVKEKFHRAHQASFSKMKSIAACYQEGLARQKSLGDSKRPVTPAIASTKKERRVSLTSKARAKMKSVTPSKTIKKLTSTSSVKKPWERPSKGTVFKPAATTTATASYNFSNKTVKFEASLKEKNTSGDRMKRQPCTPGNVKKNVPTVKKCTSFKKTANENSPVQSATKRKPVFDLQASLKKNLSYKPYTGKIPPVK